MNFECNFDNPATLRKATERFQKSARMGDVKSAVVFNVQNHRTEPLLNVADYLCWVVQRVFERGEMRYYNFVQDKIKLVVDLFLKLLRIVALVTLFLFLSRLLVDMMPRKRVMAMEFGFESGYFPLGNFIIVRSAD